MAPRRCAGVRVRRYPSRANVDVMPNETPQQLVDRLTVLVPDFPSPGILFRDLTPVFADARGLRVVTDELLRPYAGSFDVIAGIEARGFLLAAAAAYSAGVGAATIRKAGKLPGPVIGTDYALEYGTARLEMHPHSIPRGARVLIVDDVLATGGTLAAAARLCEEAGADVVGMSVILELDGLDGRQALQPYTIATVVTA